MKILCFLVLLSALLTCPAAAGEPDAALHPLPTLPDCTPGQPDVLEELLAQRGCCSWHGGMSGQCLDGRVVCNDGTLSPSCRCRTSAAPGADA